MNIAKVIVISAAVSANVVIWYEIFGVGFLVALGLAIAVVVLFSRR
ncbi:MAG: hypothetical protein NG740_03035 [Omnitrophica bacterium]|nr:hypothetical protein [Candidatus Omnitrophota bacterium]